MRSGSDLRRPAGGGAGDDPALFVSDAHFGREAGELERRRVERFVRFLREIRGRARTLYVVGDLFDFWFEYAETLPRVPLLVVAELSALVREGVDVHFIAGNHDFWVGRCFEESVGAVIHHEPVDLRIQGKRLYVTHGDDLTAGHEAGYRFFRGIVRNRLAIAAYRLIHPDIGIPIARWASGKSRGATDRKKYVLNKTLEDAVRRKLREGFDGVLLGHIHVAEQFRYEEGECLMLGDWIDRSTYAEMTGGVLALKEWEGE
jgi:UDP-2,3-diacylglucosamine hydrolase